MQLAQNLQQAVNHHPVLHNRGKAPVDIGAPAKDDRHPVPRHRGDAQSHVFDRVGGNLQGQKLVRLSSIDGIGHDAVPQRIENRQIAQKAALVGVDPVIGMAGGVQQGGRAPVGRRMIHAVHLADDVAPEMPDV